MIKKLMACLLAGTFAVGSAFADQDDTVYVWFYDPAGPDTICVISNSLFHLDVFIMTSEDAYAGDLHLPLGINDIFFDDIPLDECSCEFWPFQDWDDASFLQAFEGSPPNPDGFHSRSFAGWADLGSDPNPWLWFDTPTRCLIFGVNAPIDDTLYSGNTYCSDSDTIPFQNGVSSTLDGPCAGDTLGIFPNSMVLLYPCVYFLPNQFPIIGEFELPLDCIYVDICDSIEIFDADGDSLTVEVNAGTVELVGIDGEPGEPTTYTYEWCFDMEDFCGQNFIDELVITADDGVTDPVSATFGPITIIGKMTTSMEDTIYIWPGLDEWMPVYLDVAECFCLGAFDLTIGFDISVLAVTDVMRGDMIMGGEFFDVAYDLGTVNVSFINDLDDGNPAEDICGIDPEEPVFYLNFLLAPGEYPVDFVIPVCFHDEEPYYTTNGVIDKHEQCIWFSHGCEGIPDTTFEEAMQLNLECGNIKVLPDTNIILGDLNLNGYPFEIGDVVVAYNAVLRCDQLSLRQRLAGDIDQDGNSLTVTDLLYFYYIIMGMMDPDELIPPYVFPNDPQSDTLIIESTDALSGEELALAVHLITVDTLITLQFYVVSDTQYVSLDSLNLNDEISFTQVTCYGNPHVLILHFPPDEIEFIYPGTYYLGDLIAHVNPDIQVPVTTYIEFSNAPDSLLYTGLANPTFFEPITINSEIHITPTGIDTDKNAGLPVSFNLAAYPNPFNCNLRITVTSPVESEVVIYDLLGRVVKTFHADSGENSFTWDAKDENGKSIGSGIYFVRARASALDKVKRVLYLK